MCRLFPLLAQNARLDSGISSSTCRPTDDWTTNHKSFCYRAAMAPQTRGAAKGKAPAKGGTKGKSPARGGGRGAAKGKASTAKGKASTAKGKLLQAPDKSTIDYLGMVLQAPDERTYQYLTCYTDQVERNYKYKLPIDVDSIDYDVRPDRDCVMLLIQKQKMKRKIIC